MFDLSGVSTGGQRELVLYDLRGADGESPPVLYVLFAGDSNKQYQNALIAKNNKYRRRSGNAPMTPDRIEREKKDLIEVFAAHVIKGWKNMRGADGEEVPFGQDKARTFLTELGDKAGWMLVRIIQFCQDPYNFLPEGHEPVDLEEAGKD